MSTLSIERKETKQKHTLILNYFSSTKKRKEKKKMELKSQQNLLLVPLKHHERGKLIRSYRGLAAAWHLRIEFPVTT